MYRVIRLTLVFAAILLAVNNLPSAHADSQNCDWPEPIELGTVDFPDATGFGSGGVYDVSPDVPCTLGYAHVSVWYNEEMGMSTAEEYYLYVWHIANEWVVTAYVPTNEVVGPTGRLIGTDIQEDRVEFYYANVIPTMSFLRVSMTRGSEVLLTDVNEEEVPKDLVEDMYMTEEECVWPSNVAMMKHHSENVGYAESLRYTGITTGSDRGWFSSLDCTLGYTQLFIDDGTTEYGYFYTYFVIRGSDGDFTISNPYTDPTGGFLYPLVMDTDEALAHVTAWYLGGQVFFFDIDDGSMTYQQDNYWWDLIDSAQDAQARNVGFPDFVTIALDFPFEHPTQAEWDLPAEVAFYSWECLDERCDIAMMTAYVNPYGFETGNSQSTYRVDYFAIAKNSDWLLSNPVLVENNLLHHDFGVEYDDGNFIVTTCHLGMDDDARIVNVYTVSVADAHTDHNFYVGTCPTATE